MREELFSMGQEPVSVIIPTYRGQAHLQRALDSVFGQTWQNTEIIVVDDNDPESAAREDTAAIMERNRRENVFYFCHDRNRNGSAARNTGISHAHGDYICFLDDDDMMLPRRVEEAAMKLREGCDAAFADVLICRDGRLSNTVRIRREDCCLYRLLTNDMLIGSGSNLFLRKDLLLRLGGFDESLLRHQDYEFLIRLFSSDAKTDSTGHYSLIKHAAPPGGSPRYAMLRDVKRQILGKYMPAAERSLTEEQKRDVFIYHANELLKIAIFEQNHEGIREQKEALRTLGYQPRFTDSAKAVISRIDFTGLSQKLYDQFNAARILKELKENQPECYDIINRIQQDC